MTSSSFSAILILKSISEGGEKMPKDNKGKRPDWVPPVEPGKPDEPPKRPDIPHREVKPERPHGGGI